MTKSNTTKHSFPRAKGRKVEAEFSGGAVTSDGGILLLREAERRTGLLSGVADRLEDHRQPGKITHSIESMLRQRVFGIALGAEDLNDHTTLRSDPAWQVAAEQNVPLSSASTLCRLENRADRAAAWSIHEVVVEKFIESYSTPPKRLILDFDATDNPLYGNQEGKFFHGYYRHYCFLPLYVTCGDWVLVSYLRRSNIDAAKHAAAILSLLVKALRRAWPEVEIVFRGDGGFCRHRLFSWCERNDVKYIVGMAKNSRLLTAAEELTDQAKERFLQEGKKQRLFTDFSYAAGSWSAERRVVAKAEHSEHGSNPRFIVANITGDPQQLYDELYCARGDMENRIKQQLEMFSERTSCHAWWPNQFRLLLSNLAYTLVHVIRSVGLVGTEFARAQVGTVRLKLLKIGAVIVENTRRVRFLLSSAYPHQDTFFLVARRLSAT